MPAHIDYSGRRFSRLLVISRAASEERGGKLRTYWRCRCDCGDEAIVMGDSLKSGNTQSCGCLKRETKPLLRHSKTGSRTYNAWANAKARCSNPNHQSYKHYGGRGIHMCEEWRKSFEAFLRDMGDAPPSLELERKDNDGPYAPWNCEWATRAQQCRNRRYLGRSKAA